MVDDLNGIRSVLSELPFVNIHIECARAPERGNGVLDAKICYVMHGLVLRHARRWSVIVSQHTGSPETNPAPTLELLGTLWEVTALILLEPSLGFR